MTASQRAYGGRRTAEGGEVVSRVIVNGLSGVYHAVADGWPWCGARFPRIGMDRDAADSKGFRPCRRCFRGA